MNPSLTSIIVFSLEDLETQISAVREKDPKIVYVNLVIYGTEMAIQPFSFEKIETKDIKWHVGVEIQKLLSLKATDITFDYQIFKTEGGRVDGVFIGMPKARLNQYLNALNRARLIPISITSYFCLAVNSFLSTHKDAAIGSCFLDLSRPSYAHFAFLNKGVCEIIRQIHFENIEEAKKEIVLSLRSASAKSNIKQFEKIYVLSPLEISQIIAPHIKSNVNTTVDILNPDAFIDSQAESNNYFKLGLTKDLTFTVSQRALLFNAARLVLAVLILLCLSRAVTIWSIKQNLNQFKKSYTMNDYEYAVRLKEQIK